MRQGEHRLLILRDAVREAVRTVAPPEQDRQAAFMSKYFDNQKESDEGVRQPLVSGAASIVYLPPCPHPRTHTLCYVDSRQRGRAWGCQARPPQLERQLERRLPAKLGPTPAQARRAQVAPEAA